MTILDPHVAWQTLENRQIPRASQRVPRGSAVGRILAEPLVATVDMPPADMSAMDGYAVAGEVSPGVPLPVVGIAPAGRPADFTLAAGETAKIMTGAVVPEGADRVVPVEESDGGTERVVLRNVTPKGKHIRRGGEVTRRGETVLEAGSVLSPAAISLAASHGAGELSIIPAPEVAVIVTGDEVVPPEVDPGPGQLRDSNSSFLLAAGRMMGLDVDFLGIAPDDPEGLEELVGRGLEHEVLLLTGGVSMGDFDFVDDALEKLGCEILFEKVAIQPGKPLVAARHDGGWVFGLPGNPASVMVTFWLYVRPFLRRLMGFEDGFWHGALNAELEGPLPGAKARDRFLVAWVRFADGRIFVTPQIPQGSHDVVAYAQGTALVRVPPHATPTEAGEPCEVLLLD